MEIVRETDDRFYLSESRIPNAGVGVFAKVPLKKGDFLEVIGVMVPSTGVTAQCSHFAQYYKFAARPVDNTYHIVPLGYGGMVNHAVDHQGQNCQIDYIQHSPRNPASSIVVLRFLRDIEPHEELLHYYSDEINGKMKWIATSTDTMDKEEAEWSRFLSHDLYDLGRLKELK